MMKSMGALFHLVKQKLYIFFLKKVTNFIRQNKNTIHKGRVTGKSNFKNTNNQGDKRKVCSGKLVMPTTLYTILYSGLIYKYNTGDNNNNNNNCLKSNIQCT